MRDPKIDPREGDCVMATIGGRSVMRTVVNVVLAEPRADMTYRARKVRYTSNVRRGEHPCWITTWQDWCHKNRAEVLETAGR